MIYFDGLGTDSVFTPPPGLNLNSRSVEPTDVRK